MEFEAVYDDRRKRTLARRVEVIGVGRLSSAAGAAPVAGVPPSADRRRLNRHCELA